MVPHILQTKVVGNDGSQGEGRLPLGAGCPPFIRALKVRCILVEAQFSFLGPPNLGAH